METILIRYCEIGLKSLPVRKRFETILRDNILAMLAQEGVEALISFAEGRIYLDSEDTDGCVKALKRTFGIASVSVTRVCPATMEDICRTAAEFSLESIGEGQSFAVRARREGSHEFTSMEIAKEAGSAIFLANEGRGVKVDLHNPDKEIFIEVRGSTAYVFDGYINCPGGLPMGSQGKVLAEVEDDRGVVSAWTMMRRGCRVYVTGNGDDSVLRMYDVQLHRVDEGFSPDREMLAKISGAGVDTFAGYDYGGSDLPVFFPTVGMTDGEVSDLLAHISSSSF